MVFLTRLHVQRSDILLAGVLYDGIQLHGFPNVNKQLGYLASYTQSLSMLQ